MLQRFYSAKIIAYIKTYLLNKTHMILLKMKGQKEKKHNKYYDF